MALLGLEHYYNYKNSVELNIVTLFFITKSAVQF